MKIIDKIGLAFFSIIILLISILICLLVFGWANVEMVADILQVITSAENIKNITLLVAIILIIWTLKCIFFSSESKETMQSKEGILLENENGKLLVSRDTIESLARTVVKSFNRAETVMTKVEVDEQSKVKVYITLAVNPEALIKDLSNKLQQKIKEAIKKSIDLEFTEVIIRIKNNTIKKENKIK